MRPVTFSVFRNKFREAVNKEIEEKMGITSRLSEMLDMKKVDSNANEEYMNYREAALEYKVDVDEFIDNVIPIYV